MTDKTAKITFDETGDQPLVSIQINTSDTQTTVTLDGVTIDSEIDEVLYMCFKSLGYEAEVIYSFGGDHDDEDFGEDLGEPLDWDKDTRGEPN